MSSAKLTLPVATVIPAASADGVELFSESVGGVTRLFVMQSDGTTAIPVLTHAGSPNGVVTAGKGALCADITNAVLYQNTDGVTAWAQIGGITGVGTANKIAKFTGAVTQGDSSITDDGTTVSTPSDISQAKTGPTSWVVTTRASPNTYPVPTVQPVTADTVLAFDIMPKGSPLIGAGGYSWIDVCDVDFVANPAIQGHGVRLGIGLGSHANLDSQAFNGAAALPLALSVGGSNVQVLASTGVTFNQNLLISPPSPNAVTVSGNMNSGCISAISNTNAGAAAYAKVTASNDGSTGEICLFAFGSGYTTNGALQQDTGVVYSGAGMSGGLNVVAGAAAGDLRFYTGGLAAGNKRLTIDAAGNAVASGTWQAASFQTGAGGPVWKSGAGSPEGVVAAPVGSLWTRTDGAATTTLYVKESGVGNTGWAAVMASPNPTQLAPLWTQDNMAAGQTNVALQITANFTKMRIVRDGWLSGLAANLSEAVTAGTVTAEVTVNGVGTGLSVSMTSASHPSGDVNTRAKNVTQLYAGDEIGVRLTTTVGFTPTTSDIMCTVDVVEIVIA